MNFRNKFSAPPEVVDLITPISPKINQQYSPGLAQHECFDIAPGDDDGFGLFRGLPFAVLSGLGLWAIIIWALLALAAG